MESENAVHVENFCSIVKLTSSRRCSGSTMQLDPIQYAGSPASLVALSAISSKASISSSELRANCSLVYVTTRYGGLLLSPDFAIHLHQSASKSRAMK